MRISDWSSDVCSSDLKALAEREGLSRGNYPRGTALICPAGRVPCPTSPTNRRGGRSRHADPYKVRGRDMRQRSAPRSRAATREDRGRAEERSVGKGGVSRGASRCTAVHSKKKKKKAHIE